MENKPKILLIDDDLALLDTATLLLRDAYNVLSASSVATAKAIVKNNDIDVTIVDLNFEGQEADGLDFIDWADEQSLDLPVVVLSGDQSTERVVSAMRRKLVDFIPKSRDYERDLKTAIGKGLALKKSRDEARNSFVFRTRSPRVKKLLDMAERIVQSGTDCAVLITGETGTGKEVLAKHFAARVKKRLVAANMAGIPKDTAESELFGHSKGAFTGAHADKAGLITQAHNGIFFLDELGECSLAVQAKLLRVIQEKEIQPVGSSAKPRKIEVQFLAATNQDLPKMVEQGNFRLDLLQRLNTMTLCIPPLRERPEDIELYTSIFLNQFSDGSFSLKASGIDALLSYSWPGNVRELENVIKKIVILSNKKEINAETVREALGESAENNFTDSESLDDISKIQNRRSEVLNALEQSRGNRTKAAELLGVHSTTLLRWMKRLGVASVIQSRPGRPPVRMERDLA